MALAVDAAAQPHHARVDPAWLIFPTADDFRKAYPPDALKSGVTGKVELGCEIDAEGLAKTCQVIQEDPKGMRFGEAALALRERFRFRPASHDEKPFPSKVVIPLEFRPGAPPTPHLRTLPDWLKVPSAPGIRAVYPLMALKQQINGVAYLNCEVGLQGLVRDCSVAFEDPPGMGFGAAALSLSQNFLFAPATLDGAPVVDRVTVPITFSLSGGRDVHHRPPGQVVHVTSTVPWASAPSARQVADAYPKGANSDFRTGQVVLDCDFSAAGNLVDCGAGFEDPKGRGFAAAANSLVPLFHLDPKSMPDVDLTQVRINLTVQFIPPNDHQERRVIDHPDWIGDGGPGADLFPAKAKAAGLSTGRAVLDCVPNAQGKMTSCEVVSEDPAGIDFGAAAQKTAEAMTVNPWTSSGEPADGAHLVFAVRINKAVTDAAVAKAR